MEIGITGLPQSGKTTLFRALTQGRTEGRGVVKVPDPRLEELSNLFHPRKVVPAEIVYIDEAPPPKGLSPLSTADALILVLRTFRDERIPYPAGALDARWALASLQAELIFHDLAILEKRLERIEDSLRGPKVEREALRHEQTHLVKVKTALEKEAPLRDQGLTPEETKLLEGFNLLTAKPLMAMLNIGEEQLAEAPALEAEWHNIYPKLKTLSLCAQLEMELAQLPPPEAEEFRAALNLKTSGVDRVIQLSYELIGAITFYTTASDELRAWTVPQGSPALKAAGKIHSDMERGFIRAEVIAFADLMSCGSLAEARRRGRLRLEGKTYPVQDGDIITFLFHV